MKTDQEIVKDFIQEQDLAVVSTVTGDFLPSAAVVGIRSNDKMEIFFGTFLSSRKSQNLAKNPRVALVIGWNKGRTVQYEGEVHKLSGAALKEFQEANLEHMPTAAKLVSKKEAVFYKISPKWIRYMDLSKDPWEEIIIRF